MKIKYFSLYFLLFSSTIILPQDTSSDISKKEKIQWVDAIEYLKRLKENEQKVKSVQDSPKIIQQNLMQYYKISQKDVEQFRSTRHSDKQALLWNWNVMGYLDNSEGFRPWYKINISNPHKKMCSWGLSHLTYRAKDVTPQQLSALLQLSKKCINKKQQEIEKLKKRNAEGYKYAIGFREDEIERDNKSLDIFRDRFPHITPNESYAASDLPEEVRIHHEEYNNNVVARKALKEKTMQDICTKMKDNLKLLYYNTNHNQPLGSEHTVWISTLIDANQLCEKIQEKK